MFFWKSFAFSMIQRMLAIWSLVPLLFFFFNFILFLNFTILYWFCQILKWICHRYTCVPHPEPSSLLPHHSIPLGRPSAPAPSIQYRASNLDWQLISYMVFYFHFQTLIWASLVAQLVKNLPYVGKIPWRRERLPTPVFWPGEVRGKEFDKTKWLSLHFTY